MIQIPLFREWSFLNHGFGTRYLTEGILNNDNHYEPFSKIDLNQKHSHIIHSVDRSSGKGLEGDGLITAEPYVLLVIKTADCLPVFLIDIDKRVVGAVHCGWRGSGKRILQKALKKMQKKYSCHMSSLYAAMGPCICRKCYEVGAEVFDFFKGEGLSLKAFHDHPDNKEKYFLDLRKVNQLQLQEIGVGKDRILDVDYCTYCNEHLLSYRRDRNKEGRMLSFIGMSF